MPDTASILKDLPGHEPLELPFAWSDLPRRECPPGGHRAISTGAQWSTRLLGGREVRLTGLHQYLTYGGVLAGVPESDEVRAWPIEGAVRLALELHPVMPWTLVILPPELQRSRVATQRDGKPVELAIDFLPPVCSIGSFESKSTEVIAVWFQRAFGPPEDGFVTECIRKVEWERVAYEVE